MVTKAGERREKRERQSSINSGVSGCTSAILGLTLIWLPHTAVYIVGDLVSVLIVSLYNVWHCWGLSETPLLRGIFSVVHMSVLTLLGIAVWPHIKVSPKQITFRGISQETYDFTLRNDTESDAYLVRVPFQVSKGMDGKIEPRVSKDEIDASLPLEEYGYCYGSDGNEYVVVEIPALPSHQLRRFSLIYSGGPSAMARVAPIKFAEEQPPYSPTTQAGGIEGDYKACHIHGVVRAK